MHGFSVIRRLPLLLVDLNRTRLCLIGRSRGICNRDVSIGVGRCCELLHERLVCCPCGCDDIEVLQHWNTVDGNVEYPLACRFEEELRKMESNGVSCSRRQVGEGIAERATLAFVLVDRSRRGADNNSRVNRISGPR